MICEICGREIDEENEDVWECDMYGKLVCDNCMSGDRCDDCEELARHHYDIFSPFGSPFKAKTFYETHCFALRIQQLQGVKSKHKVGLNESLKITTKRI